MLVQRQPSSTSKRMCCPGLEKIQEILPVSSLQLCKRAAKIFGKCLFRRTHGTSQLELLDLILGGRRVGEALHSSVPGRPCDAASFF